MMKTLKEKSILTRAQYGNDGQGTFLRNGLMEYGSIFGHGAYLGPDFTADYLHRAAVLSIDFYAGLGSDKARAATIADCKTNRYDSAADTLTFTAAQAHSYQELLRYYHAFFAEPTTKYGLRAGAITDAIETRNLTAFFAWSAWCASALRLGLQYSYTNNWPPEPLVDNHPTADTVVWSVLSLVTLLGGIGLLLAAFGRWNFLGWHGRERDRVSFRPPGDVVLTPAQRACAWFFLVMTLMFLLQTLLGGATEHYRAELSNFFGLDLGRLIPFNIARTWHVQLALFFVSTGFLAAGIFLLPMIAGREPPRQHWLAYALLVALAVVVFGSMIGEFITIHGVVNAVLLNGLPYPDANRLVILDEYRLQHGSRTVSWLDFLDWRKQNRTFDDMAAYRLSHVNLTGIEEPTLLRVAEVSSPFFRILGTQPLSGRTFSEREDLPGANPVVVVSHELWKNRLGGDPNFAGKTLTLDGISYSVIGVLPPEFNFFDKRVDAYLPVGLHGADG
jgi:nitric oxide reductase large subunit